MSNLKTGAGIASAVAMFAMASLAAASTPSEGAAKKAMSADESVHCQGVNSCKGTADCKTADNACKGQNSCKGHGFKVMKASECLEKGGKVGDHK